MLLRMILKLIKMSLIIKMEFYPLVQRKSLIITIICIKLSKMYQFLNLSKLLTLNLKEINQNRIIKKEFNKIS